jgi:signal transduction histidine kinase/CheY-like chemotaxis protein
MQASREVSVQMKEDGLGPSGLSKRGFAFLAEAATRRRFGLAMMAVALVLLAALIGVRAFAPAFSAIAIVIGVLFGVAIGLLGLGLSIGRKLGELGDAVAQAERDRDKAEESNKAKTRFLAAMSHEIRTPMNGVLGMVGLMLETHLTPEQKNYVMAADSSGRALLSIIDEILDTSKIESGRMALDAHPFNLAALVESVTELLSPRAHAKGIEIACHISRHCATIVRGDELRLRQVLLNLAGNAIKFTETGGVSITVSRAQGDAGQINFELRDTGIGMNQDELGRVFEDFVQAGADTWRRFGGTGLGLPIARKLVGLMGGELHVESRSGAGTIFSFSVALPSEATEQTQAEMPLAGRHYELAIPSIQVAQCMRANLEEMGASVHVLAGPEELREALLRKKREDAAALICDAHYANILTAWKARNSKAAPAGKQVWLLLHPEERRQLRALLSFPMAGYLIKPVRRSTLLRQLTAHDHQSIEEAVSDLRRLAMSANPQKRLAVLLAEDNPVSALLARTILEKAGHRVTHATSGTAAIAQIEGGATPDLIIMDIEMPECDGLEAARRIRAFEAGSGAQRIPILALTASALGDDRSQCLAAGMDAYLTKPFDRQDLEEAIHTLLRRANAA